MAEEKKFPTPAMLKAREEWAKKPEEEKEALWKASLEKARRHRPPIDLEALGENIEE